MKISVVMANYNGAAFIGEAIQSVLDQDYGDFELIVVDDGSTDESLQIISGLRKKKRRKSTIFKLIYGVHNAGQAAAFTAGCERAKGELVSFIDSDDVWFSRKLSTVAATFGDPFKTAFHQHNLSMIRNGRHEDESFRNTLKIGDYFAEACRTQRLPTFMPTSGLTFSKRALNMVLPIPTEFRRCADGYLTRTAMCFGGVTASIDMLGSYRVHSANGTFENESFSHSRYIYSLLIPSLNHFSRSHGLELEFPGSRPDAPDLGWMSERRPSK